MLADKEQELAGEFEAVKGELERLKQEKKSFTKELESKNAAIVELEQTVVSRDSEIAILKQTVAESDKKLAELNESLAQAVASYRAMLMEANPEIPDELLTGDTIDALNESLENARALIGRVKQAIEAETSKTRIPAGAPQRAPLDLSVLSPREKIQYAIGGKR